jgi:hypothetical protein
MNKLINLVNPGMIGGSLIRETLAIYVDIRSPGSPRCKDM